MSHVSSSKDRIIGICNMGKLNYLTKTPAVTICLMLMMNSYIDI